MKQTNLDQFHHKKHQTLASFYKKLQNFQEWKYKSKLCKRYDDVIKNMHDLKLRKQQFLEQQLENIKGIQIIAFIRPKSQDQIQNYIKSFNQLKKTERFKYLIRPFIQYDQTTQHYGYLDILPYKQTTSNFGTGKKSNVQTNQSYKFTKVWNEQFKTAELLASFKSKVIDRELLIVTGLSNSGKSTKLLSLYDSVRVQVSQYFAKNKCQYFDLFYEKSKNLDCKKFIKNYISSRLVKAQTQQNQNSSRSFTIYQFFYEKTQQRFTIFDVPGCEPSDQKNLAQTTFINYLNVYIPTLAKKDKKEKNQSFKLQEDLKKKVESIYDHVYKADGKYQKGKIDYLFHLILVSARYVRAQKALLEKYSGILKEQF